MKSSILILAATTGLAFTAPPEFSHPDAVLNIPEGTGMGTIVFHTGAIDPDGDAITYGVSPNEFFSIPLGANAVILRRALDFESISTHQLTLVATDESGEMAVRSLSVNVIDQNEIVSNDSDLGRSHFGQRGGDARPVTTRRLAVYLIHFKGADLSLFPGGANPIMPTKAEMKELLNGELMKDYWRAQSWGQFEPTVDVFGYFEHPKQISELPTDYSVVLAELGNLIIDDPGYDPANYDDHVYTFINDSDSEWFPGAAAGGADVTINGVDYPLIDMIYHGAYIDGSGGGSLTRQVDFGFMNHLGVWEEGSNAYALTRFQRTFLHELAHSLGLSWHENFSSNSDRFVWELPLRPHVTRDELDEEYGHPFALLGRSHFSMNMTAAGRDWLGWTNATNRYSIKRPGKHTVRLHPINRTVGFRSIEVRIPHRHNRFWQDEDAKNHGYLLEVRESDIWSYLDHPGIVKNTHGILVQATDGYASRMIDMSPSELLTPPWSDSSKVFDIRDLALKPGMRVRNHEVEFSNVVAHEDGSFSIDIEVFDRAGWENNAFSSIEAFRRHYFGSAAAIADASDNGDPDGDELPNRIEYALGTDPTSYQPRSSAILSNWVSIGTDKYLEVEIKSAVVTEEETMVVVEGSVDLIKWSTDEFEVVKNTLSHHFEARDAIEDWVKTRVVTYRSKNPATQTRNFYWRVSTRP